MIAAAVIIMTAVSSEARPERQVRWAERVSWPKGASQAGRPDGPGGTGGISGDDRSNRRDWCNRADRSGGRDRPGRS